MLDQKVSAASITGRISIEFPCSFMLLFFLAGVNSEAVYGKIKTSLKSKPSTEKDNLAILWALASLARSVNRTLLADDFNAITSQTDTLIERFEITDSLMQQEFAQMRHNFDETKAGILSSIEEAREKIRDELDNFQRQLIGHCISAVESTKEVHFNYLNNAFGIIRTFFEAVVNSLTTHAVLFFVFFQVLLVFGILFYRKFERQMTLFLS
jgi:hypothetical protein